MLLAAVALPPGPLPPASAFAMWEKLSDADLVAKSEVIVRGEVVGLTRLEAPGQGPLALAGVKVQETFKGPERSLVLVVEPLPEGPISSSDISHAVGTNGLWFLRARPVGPGGVFLADHPQRFVSEKQEGERFAALLKLVRQAPAH